MPLIYFVRCQQCDFQSSGPEFCWFAVQKDASEVLCPHPLETSFAQMVTGKSWDELKKQGRLKPRHHLLCLECGEEGYYDLRPQYDEIVLFRDLVEDASATVLVSGTQVLRSPPDQCVACKANALVPISGKVKVPVREWFAKNPPARALRTRKQTCPKCKQGRLQWGISGIS